MRTSVLAAAALAALTGVATASPRAPAFQTEDPRGDRRAGLELHLGQIELPLGLDLTVLALELSTTLPLGDRSTLRLRLPLAHASGSDTSGTSLGNFTVGFHHLIDRVATGGGGARLLSVDASLSLPTASDSGESAGAASALAN